MKITLDQLTKRFPSRSKKGTEVIAVNKMSITIPSGKLVGLLGPSGCGKSTTLFMLSGLEEPSSGKIYFDDQDVTTLAPEKRGIGLVFQNYALYPHMTVEQNIMFPLQNIRVPKEEAKERALDAARLVQIEDLMQRKPSELSGGQQQRVAIARALVKMPNVLLLDEPLSNLDARLRLQTREEIKRIQRETGITTVFVTHDQEEAMSICDVMVVMKRGVVQQIGEPQAIYDSPENLFVANFLGTPPINIFKGKVKGNKVYIGKEKVAECKDASNKYQEILASLENERNALNDELVALQNEAKVNEEAVSKANEAIEAINENIQRTQAMIESKEYEVYVGVRPEGFVYSEEGALTLSTNNIEVMGRDKTVVSTHECSTKPTIRSIIDSDIVLPQDAKSLKFNLKPNKVFIFDSIKEERI